MRELQHSARPPAPDGGRAPLDAWGLAVDALGLEVAILDGDGVIVACSRAWRGALPDAGTGVGGSLPAAAEAAAGVGVPGAADAAAGIRAVVAGTREAFEAPCPLSPSGRPRTMAVRAAPDGAGPGGVAVVRRVPWGEEPGMPGAAGADIGATMAEGPLAAERRAADALVRREVGGLTMLGRVRTALAEGGFELFAQPIVDLRSGETRQHELLIRMRDRGGGLLAPAAFLPVAQRSGLIGRIDRWVVRRAAELAGAGNHVAMNLSAGSLGEAGLVGKLEEALRRAGADPSRLVIEITETAVLRDERAARSFIARARELGCRFALDDFGAGYGGLSYLKRLDVDFLKIDREFIRDIGADAACRHVVRAVVDLARGFGVRTVAEGVEDVGTLGVLRGLGVDRAQGFGIARPAPAAEVLIAPAAGAGSAP